MKALRKAIMSWHCKSAPSNSMSNCFLSKVRIRLLQFQMRFNSNSGKREIQNLVVGMLVKKYSEKFLKRLDVLLAWHLSIRQKFMYQMLETRDVCSLKD